MCALEHGVILLSADTCMVCVMVHVCVFVNFHISVCYLAHTYILLFLCVYMWIFLRTALTCFCTSKSLS